MVEKDYLVRNGMLEVGITLKVGKADLQTENEEKVTGNELYVHYSY